ncbi:MAG: hypothetical protein HRU26_14530, partial [Psychroserpens sp.]|nr:hypothetical protein [Psychroserpens sp.]
MKKHVILVVLSFFCLTIYSQNSDLIDAKFDSIDAIGHTDQEKTLSLIREVKQLIKDKSSENYLEAILSELKIRSARGDLDAVLILADSLVNQNTSDTYKAQGLIEKGIVYHRKTKNEEALNSLSLALPIAEKTNDNRRRSQIFKIMGNISFINGNGIEAIESYKKAAYFSTIDKNDFATGL